MSHSHDTYRIYELASPIPASYHLSMQNGQLDSLHSFQSRLLAAIEGISEADLQRRERPDAWSVFHVIAHLGDHEVMTAVRIRMILAREGSALPPFDQNAWIDSGHRDEPLASVVDSFTATRRGNLELLRRLRPEDLARQGNHPQYGDISISEIVTRNINHQEKHLGQIERIKKTLGLVAVAV